MERFPQRSVRGNRGSGSLGRWRLALGCCLAAGCLLGGGCSNGKQLQHDLVTRELRLQEDEIYRLEDYLEEYQRKVCVLREENAALRRRLTDGAGQAGERAAGSNGDGDSERSLLDLPDDPPEPNGGADAPTDEFTPPDLPEIDFGDPIAPPTNGEGSLPPPIDVPGGDAPAFDGGPSGAAPAPPFEPSTPAVDPEVLAPPAPSPSTSAGVSEQPAPVTEPFRFQPGDGPVALLTPTPTPTPAAAATPGASGPELPTLVERVSVAGAPGPAEPNGQATLVVSVAPQTADGDAAPFSGAMSLLLRDPAAAEPVVRVARWDFSPEEVADAWGELIETDEMQFLIALPNDAPSGRPLELWVRLLDPSGVKTLGRSLVALADSDLADGDPPRPALSASRSTVEKPAAPWPNPRPVAMGSPTSTPQAATDSAGWRGSSAPPAGSTIRLVTHDAPASPTPTKTPPAWRRLPTNPPQGRGSNSGASPSEDDPEPPFSP